MTPVPKRSARVRRAAAVALCALAAGAARAEEFLPLERVVPGLKGYGLTVFSGQIPERFDVEVLGVVRNQGPERATILVRVGGHGLEESGIVAGMSGSPVYFEGKLAGAVSSGWGFSKSPIGGVTPIESMLEIDAEERRSAAPRAAKEASKARSASGLSGADTSRFREGFLRTLGEDDEARLAFLRDELRRRLPAAGPARAALLSPLAAGIPAETLARHRAAFEPLGLDLAATSSPLASPGGGSAASPGAGAAPAPAALGGGSAIVALLVDGDMRLGATGTVTTVLPSGRFLAFGHPFLSFGELELPVAPAYVIGTLPSLYQSFKIAYPLAASFRMTRDREAGISGETAGGSPAMIPVVFRLEEAGGFVRTFSFRLAPHPKLLPTLLAITADAALTAADPTPRERTMSYRVSLDTSAGRIAFADRATGARAKEIVLMTAATLAATIADNEFEEPRISAIELICKSEPGERRSRLIDAALASRRVAPGESVSATVRLADRRGEETTHVVRITVPRDTPDGKATLVVGDGASASMLRTALEPAEPRTLADFARWVASLTPSDRLVATLLLPTRGATTGARTIAVLPPTAASLLAGARVSGGAREADVDARVVGEFAVPFGSPLQGSIRLEFDVEKPRS